MDSNDNLITKIEEVKKKLAEFESILNIRPIDIDLVTIDKNSELINQIENYKSRINNIEKEIINSKTSYPIEQEPLLSNKKAETVNLDIKKTMSKVELERQEIEYINDLLDKLRKNAAEQKKISAATESGTVQSKAEIKTKNVNSVSNNKTADHTGNNSVKSGPVSKVENHSEPIKANSNPVNITENDLHSISELISKLDELLRSNKEIADKLNELLKEQRAYDNKTSRSHELMERLAILTSNSNLGQI